MRLWKPPLKAKQAIKLVIIIQTIILSTLSSPGVLACTIFTASQEDIVLFGNNEDYSNPNTYIWVIPPTNETYGGVYFGFDDLWPQGGINEKGLAFDINALPEAPLNSHPEKPELDNYEGYIALQNSATVDEAIEILSGYNWGNAIWGQIHIADANGEAVVISAGPDREVSFTRKEPGDSVFISTNFNLGSNPKDEREGLCWRYDKAVEALEGDAELTVEHFRDIVDAVHVEGAYQNTLYSTIYDLKNGAIYVYYFHQYDEVVTLDVTEKITQVHEPVPLKDLFSVETVELASSEQSKYVFQDRFGNVLEILGVVIAVGIAYFVLRRVRS